MHCDQCGKENRLGSKFCRSCGNTLSDTSHGSSGKKESLVSNITWKSPIVVLVIGLIVLGGLVYGGTKAYAYYQVESKISTAKKLQTAGDYKGSIDTLNGWENKTFTNSQKTRIDGIKTDDQKFITFKASFDSAVAVENGTSTAKTSLSVSLQSALKDLQSIDSSYPDYKNVQAEMTKIQNALVVALQDEAGVSKKAAADSAALAEKNRQAAASAQAARTQAENNAQRAQSAADSATANAAAQAAVARGLEVQKGFRNELTAGYISYTQGVTYYGSAIKYSNSSDSLLAIAQANSARAVLNSAYSTVSDLNSRFTGLSSSYYAAANDMVSAISNLNKAIDLLVSSEGTSLDYSSSINSYKNTATSYQTRVKAFLDANYQ
ncbi:MAG: zinc ribbon domain-containing protein [Candidatus Paceibacterota bacterium]|jgi:hypothetical protein